MSLREDPGRGLGFGIFHSDSALLFNDVLTAGGKLKLMSFGGIESTHFQMAMYMEVEFWQLANARRSAFVNSLTFMLL